MGHRPYGAWIRGKDGPLNWLSGVLVGLDRRLDIVQDARLHKSPACWQRSGNPAWSRLVTIN